jgi:site-specific DNA-methyltransferase (adenine-specific)
LVWQKTTPTGHLNAKKMPLRSHEDILVFYKKLPTYNPQKTIGHERKVSTAKHKRNSKKTTNYGKHGLTTYDSTERYPKSVLTFATDKQKSALHPTQKPLELIKYLVRTYSNEGDWVLDNTCGSNTTGLACFELNRNYIGIENDFDMYEISKERVGKKNIIIDNICNKIANLYV